MAVSVVNGFVCYSSCDVSKAKQGKDPHPSTRADAADSARRASGRAEEPAVVFGGSLSGLSAASAVEPGDNVRSADQTKTQSRPFTIDLLA